MEIALLILIAAGGYLLGSINTSILVSRAAGTDIRQHGSGNAGATNTLRTLGKKAAALVMLGDVGKGVIAALLGLVIAGENGMLAGGLFAVIGHNWPVYFNFRGGKGIFTTFAVILFLDWKIGLTLFAVFAVIVLATRYVSLGSIVGSALFPVAALVTNRSLPFVCVAAVLAVLAVWRHRGNIRRLLEGTENKLGSKKKTATGEQNG